MVKDLQKRIPQHRELLCSNEWLTRYALIDPLLTALGWDLSDPAQVIPEYQSGAGRADYALFVGNPPPVVIVEAKRLGRDVLDGISQSINYCLTHGVKYFAVTDGDQWRVYETHKPVPLDQKLLLDFSISSASQRTTMTMLWFWRANFSTGDPIDVELPPEPPGPRIPVVETGPDLLALSEVSPKAHQRAPQSLKFPDSSEKRIRRWRELVRSVIAWLVETRRLALVDCPLTSPRGTHYVHVRPERKDGSRFIDPIQVKGLWIDGHGSASDHVRISRYILKSRGVDPGTVFVRQPKPMN